MLDLPIVVVEADQPVSDRDYQRHPDERIRDVRPEHGGNHQGEEDEAPSHGRRPGLGEVTLRAIRTDRLTNLLRLQLLDEPRGEREADQHGGQPRRHRSKRHVAQDVEPTQPGSVIAQGIEQLEQHLSLLPGFCRAPEERRHGPFQVDAP